MVNGAQRVWAARSGGAGPNSPCHSQRFAGQPGCLRAAFVGAMVGLERAVLPLLGEQEFGLASRESIRAFVASFGATKAVADLVAGRLTDRRGTVWRFV